jgi:hypothetical protein
MKTEEQIKKALRNREYREKNKEILRLKRVAKFEANEEKHRSEKLAWYYKNKEKQLQEEESSPMMTLKSVARLIGVRENVAQKISKTESYKMPKPKMARCDGSDLYCRMEIEEWMPFIREVVAFYSTKRKLIKLTGAAVHIVNFMQNNKAVISHCEDERKRLRELWVETLTMH